MFVKTARVNARKDQHFSWNWTLMTRAEMTVLLVSHQLQDCYSFPLGVLLIISGNEVSWVLAAPIYNFI